LNEFQRQARSYRKGIKKGHIFVVAQGRRTGKSMMSAMMSGTSFKEPEWGEWRTTSSFIPRKSIDGSLIFGFMMKRGRTMHKMKSHSRGGVMTPYRQRQYATKKQVFEMKLKGK